MSMHSSLKKKIGGKGAINRCVGQQNSKERKRKKKEKNLLALAEEAKKLGIHVHQLVFKKCQRTKEIIGRNAREAAEMVAMEERRLEMLYGSGRRRSFGF